MRAEELDKLSIKKLQERADACFIEAEKVPFIDPERHQLLVEAQFYFTAIAKKRDDQTAQRDFRMEVAVIALISIEIILSVVFGLIAIREGNQQAAITAASAAAMADAKKALETLTDQQKSSLSSLSEMNQNLQSSTGAARKQLHILQDEQTAALAQRSKKPNLVLYLNETTLDATKRIAIYPGRQTPTSSACKFALQNRGNAGAHDIAIRFELPANVKMTANEELKLRERSEIDYTFHIYTISIPDIGPHRSSAELPLTFTFDGPLEF